MTREEYSNLVIKMKEYTDAWNKGEPLVSDNEYDVLYNMLKEYEKDNVANTASPTQTLGKQNGKCKHIQKMLSIANVYDIDELHSWLRGKGDVVLSNKLDGISVELIYKNGMIDNAVLKGNGDVGKSVLNHIQAINPIPVKIDKDIDSIRGELVIRRQRFTLVKDKFKLTHPNECSLVSSIFNKKDVSELLKEVDFVAFNINGDYDKVDMFNTLKKLGFITPSYVLLQNTIALDGIVNDFNKDCEYPTDGIVVEMNDSVARKSVKHTKKYNKCAIALKPKPIMKTTTVRDIRYTLNANGLLIPNVSVDPITLKGKTISNINCYNISNLLNIGIAVGGSVDVILSGEVIPKIVFARANGNAVVSPLRCPSCDNTLVFERDNTFCKNEECEGILLATLCKEVLKTFSGVGDESIKILFNHGVRTVHDIKVILAQDETPEKIKDICSKMKEK
jgi:DNA ligase (NAD+)